MRVYPAPGLRVRDPATKLFVPEEGLEVSEHSTLWARLVRDKDVVLEKPEPPPAEPPAAEAPAQEGEAPAHDSEEPAQ